MSRLIGILFLVFIVEHSSLAMEPDGRIFNSSCAKIERDTYGDINKNVEFSVAATTQSQAWNIVPILHNNLFIKKRGILLSDALTDLISPTSKSAFECANAQAIVYWRVVLLMQPEIDEIIHTFENSDKNFAFPLVMPVCFSVSFNYATYYSFHNRTGSFMIGTKSCIIEDEWRKIQSIKYSLDRIDAIFSITDSFKQREGYPCNTEVGGILYLPNVEGIKGADKGENLYCLDSREGIFYGFGPLFKDGPQTLLAIAQNLEKKAGSTYAEQIALLEKDGLLTNMREDQHPLFWLIKAEACLCFNAEKLELAKNDLKLESSKRPCDNCRQLFSELSMCGRCKKVEYCSRACQLKSWPQHRAQCQSKG